MIRKSVVDVHLTLFVVVDEAYFSWVWFWLGNGNRGRVCHRGHGCGWHHKSRHVSLIELFAKNTGGGRRRLLGWQLATNDEVTGFRTELFGFGLICKESVKSFNMSVDFFSLTLWGFDEKLKLFLASCLSHTKKNGTKKSFRVVSRIRIDGKSGGRGHLRGDVKIPAVELKIIQPLFDIGRRPNWTRSWF